MDKYTKHKFLKLTPKTMNGQRHPKDGDELQINVKGFLKWNEQRKEKKRKDLCER